jgi:hypothetical protein
MKNILGVDVIESINDFLHDSELANQFYAQQSEKMCDFTNDPDRAARCHEAAADGCDGSYTYEVIEDFREFGEGLLKESWLLIEHELFSMDEEDYGTAYEAAEQAFEECRAAFEKDVCRCEEWHDKNGTLYSQGS